MEDKIYVPDKINDEYVSSNEMGIKKMILAALEGDPELTEFKKVVYDKNKQQYSIKIPKALALKAGIKPESIIGIVFNPNRENTLNEIKKSKLAVYLTDKVKEKEDGKDK